MAIKAAVFNKTLNLDESKLEPPDPRCPLCSSTDRQPVYILQETPEILLMNCNACHAASASRIPTKEALEEYYSAYYDSAAIQTPDNHATFDHPMRLSVNLANDYISYQGDSHISILDFGGGDGTISQLLGMQLVKRGAAHVDITVIDYHKKLVSPQDSRISINRRDTLDKLDCLYGFVIASAVIEHNPRPRTLLRSLMQRVERGGIFYIRTPYMLPLMKLLRILGLRVDFTYPGHLHDLGQVFWEGYFMNECPDDFQILKSNPSLVQTTLRKHFIRTALAYSLKAPWYLLGRSYKYVGGWEILVRKRSREDV